MRKENKNNNKKGLKAAAVAAAVFMGVTVGVNTNSVIAESMENIPALGKLVSVLRFNDGATSGGKITDGADVKEVEIDIKDKKETITINLTSDGKPLESAAHYKAEYTDNPYVMTFTISGVRQFSAAENFEALKESGLIKDVYKLITMDDSMVRFNVVFNEPVKYELKEFKEPAQLVLTLEKDEEAESKTVYSIRTASQPQGEGLGIIEEMLMDLETRVLKDENGTFLVEAGAFDSEEKANEKLQELKEKYSNIEFHLETRTGAETPKAI